MMKKICINSICYLTLAIAGGDITWEETKAVDEMSPAIKKGDKDIYRRLAKEGRIGCTSPIQHRKK